MNYSKFSILFLLLAAGGCAGAQETAKVIWGSSTKALDEGRVNAVKKTLSCSADECFDAVLLYAEKGTERVSELSLNAKGNPIEQSQYRTTDPGSLAAVEKIPVKQKNFDVFIKDRRNQRIVLMGVPGAVDTTEVGVFFTPAEKGTTIEISSLSTSAKIKASDMLFEELGKMFQEIK